MGLDKISVVKQDPDTLETGSSSYGIKKTAEGIEITDLHSKAALLRLPAQVGEAILGMLSTQQTFEDLAERYHLREKVGEHFQTTSKIPDRADTSESGMAANEMYNNFCHRTAGTVVPEASDTRDAKPSSFSREEFERSLGSAHFPAVAQIYFDKYDGKYAPEKVHSFVILGYPETEKGHLICFEKMGYRLPFRLTTLEQIWRFWVRAVDKGEGKPSEKLLITLAATHS